MGMISNLRSGTPTSTDIIIDGMKMAVIVLPSDTIRQIEEEVGLYVDKYKKKLDDKKVNLMTIRNLRFDQLLCFHCLRDPSDPTLATKAADSIDEIIKNLDVNDISRVTGKYNEIMMSKYEGLELLTEEGLEDIKKHLGQIELKDLNTVLQLHLVNFHQAMHISG